MESAVATHPRQRHRRPRPSTSSPALLLAAALLLQAAHAFHPAAAPPGKAARLQQQQQQQQQQKQKQQSPLFSRDIPLASSSAATVPPQPSQAAPAQATTATTTEDDAADAPFDWWRQWYPVALTRDLDPTSLTKATLLGRELVLWKEGGAGGQWRCFLDRCPHRLAPLSEGRVDGKTGHLQCAYHGWEFDATGACTKIPQADPEQPPAAAEAALLSRRACATALPAQVAQGMLWVWPDTSPEGLAASKVVGPALMEGVGEEEMGYLVVSREMPYGFDTLLENGIDPAHLPWAHHNIISHRSQSAFLDIRVDDVRRDGFDSAAFFPKRFQRPAAPAPPDDDDGTPEQQAAPTMEEGLRQKRTTGTRRKAPAMVPVPQSLHFRPPALLYQVINVTEAMNRIPFLAPKERVIRIVTYALPVAPGRSKVMYRFLRNYFVPPKPLRWLRWPPEWVEHLRILRVLDSDTVFLHGQERELRLLAGDGPEAVEIDRAYYMPTPADGSVRALRRWIAKYGGPKWLVPGLSSALPPLERDRRRLLDRYESHTKHCKVCRGALTNLGRLRHGIGFLSVMAFYLGLLGQSVYTRLAGGFLTVLGLTGALIVQKWEEKFVFQDWDHSKNH